MSQPFWDGLATSGSRSSTATTAVAGSTTRARAVRPACRTGSRGDGRRHGTVYTFTVAGQPTAPPFADEVPQLLAIVELNEGVRITTTLVDVAPT